MTKQLLKMNSENYLKFRALKNIGVDVENIGYNLFVSMKDRPDLDCYMETMFKNVNEILYAFKDELYKNDIKLVA